MLRHALYLCLAFTGGCQLPDLKPVTTPEAPTEPQPVASSQEPAPLPPEETPPPEAPAAPAEAKPIEPGITSTGAPTRGTLPKAVVDEKLKSAQPAVRDCYQRGLAARPDLRGNLSINFVVDPEGKVAHAEPVEVEDPLNDDATIKCVVAVIKKLEFPKPTGGRVFLNYPMKLDAPPPAAP